MLEIKIERKRDCFRLLQFTNLHNYHQVHDKNERSQKSPRQLIGRNKISIHFVPIYIVRRNCCAHHYCHGDEHKPKRIHPVQALLPKSAESWGPVRILCSLCGQEFNKKTKKKNTKIRLYKYSFILNVNNKNDPSLPHVKELQVLNKLWFF